MEKLSYNGYTENLTELSFCITIIRVFLDNHYTPSESKVCIMVIQQHKLFCWITIIHYLRPSNV